jgi:MoxR-like ATPase
MKQSVQATPTPQPAAPKTPARNGQAPPAAFAQLRHDVERLKAEVGKVIVGKAEIVEKLVLASLSEGSHVLFEDVPGLAKSVLAAAFSTAAGCKFHRIQFTPDLLPTDISGGHIFNRKSNEFEFRPGPIFTNFLLADEINRASPKTQSALLEAMAEKQVSVEGVTHRLAAPFLVLATQNPIEQEGTYPLPEAQMDRFAMRLSMGYPSLAEEQEIMDRRLSRRMDGFNTQPVLEAGSLVRMQKMVEEIHVHPAITRYIAQIVDASRRHPQLLAGASPRGSLALVKLARARAAVHNRTFVIPDDVITLATAVLAHRVILTTDARVNGVTGVKIIEDIVSKIPVPRDVHA